MGQPGFPPKAVPATPGRRLRLFGDPKLLMLRDAVVRYHGAVLADALPHWLSLVGASGTGETHSAKALWA